MNRRLSRQSLFKRPLVLLLLPNGASVGSKNMATTSDGEQSAKSSGTGPPLAAAPKRKSESEFRFYWNRIMRAEEEALKKTRPWQTLEYIPLHDQKSILCSVKGECLHNNYNFGGKPSSFWRQAIVARMVESYPVVQLQYPFGPAIEAPRGLDPTQWGEIFPQARVYLLGCTHYTEEARENARNLMAAVQPDVVMVELCRERSKAYIGMVEGESKWEVPKTEEEFREEIYKKYEQVHGKLLDDLGWFGRRKLKKHIRRMYLATKRELQMVKDSEFRAAFFAAQKVPGCAGIVLGDLHYRTHSADWLQQILNVKKHQMGRTDKLQQANIKTNLVDKRDKHMVSVLHTMLHRCTIEKLSASKRIGVEFEPVNAIAVVGKGHLKGMEERWSKPEQVYPSQ